jgi:hypothetical protein
LQEVNSGVGGGEGASNMVSGYAHDPTTLALEGKISKMESKMDEMHAMFAAFIKLATPNPPTIVVSPTKTVDAPPTVVVSPTKIVDAWAIEVQDNQQVDQEAIAKVCDAYPLFIPNNDTCCRIAHMRKNFHYESQISSCQSWRANR